MINIMCVTIILLLLLLILSSPYIQNQMQMYPPFYSGGIIPQGQRAYFPAMTGFRPWQGGPMHRPYGQFMPQRNRPMGPRGQVNVSNRMSNPPTQRLSGQRMGQPGIPSQQVEGPFSEHD